MLKNGENKILEFKIKKILKYKNEFKGYDFTDEDFRNSIAILSVLNYNLYQNSEENPIGSFFRDSLFLINKLKDLDNSDKSVIIWQFLRRFLINEIYFFLTSKNLFNNSTRDFNIIKSKQNIKIISKLEYLDFFIKESGLITNCTKYDLIIGDNFVNYEDYRGDLENKKNDYIKKNIDAKIIIDQDSTEDYLHFKKIQDYSYSNKREISLEEKTNIIEEIINNLFSLNFNFINIHELLNLEENIRRTFIKSRNSIDLNKIYSCEKKEYFFKNKIFFNLMKFLFEINSNNNKFLELFININIELKEKRKIGIDKKKCIGSFTSSLENEKYTIKIYCSKINIVLTDFNSIDNIILKDLNYKIKNLINVLGLDIKFKLETINIGKEEIKYLPSEIEENSNDLIRFYNENINKSDIKLIYKIK